MSDSCMAVRFVQHMYMKPKRNCNIGTLYRCHMGGLCGGALAAYMLGPNYVSSSQTGCMQTCTDSPPVTLLARKGSQRCQATCNCVKCAINQTGIRMRVLRSRIGSRCPRMMCYLCSVQMCLCMVGLDKDKWQHTLMLSCLC